MFVVLISLAAAGATAQELPLPGHDPRLAVARDTGRFLAVGGLVTAGAGIVVTFAPLVVPVSCPVMEGVSCGPADMSGIGLATVGVGAVSLASGLALQAYVDRRERRLPPAVLPTAWRGGAGLTLVVVR